MAANMPNKGAVKKNRSGTEIGGAWAKESPDGVVIVSYLHYGLMIAGIIIAKTIPLF